MKNTIRKKYCSFDLTKQLIELGYDDWSTNQWWVEGLRYTYDCPRNNGEIVCDAYPPTIKTKETYSSYIGNKFINHFPAIELHTAVDWMWMNFGIFIATYMNTPNEFYFSVDTEHQKFSPKNMFKTREIAIEEALSFSVKNLKLLHEN